MAEDTNPIALLEAQMAALSDTHSNLVGLIEKGSRMQMDLSNAGFDKFAEKVAKAFSDISGVAEQMEKIKTSIEVERNRQQNE